MTERTRRYVLLTSIGGGCAVLAGCPSLENKFRGIDFEQITHSESDGTHEITVQVSYVAEGGDEEWRQFHEVSIVGLDDSRNVICEDGLGNIPEQLGGGAVTLEISLNCESRPEVIETRADESPCDRGTSLAKATWENFSDSPPHYVGGTRACDE